MDRNIVKRQIVELKKIMDERNSGIGMFTDNRFSLYELDNKQENEAYRMYRDNALDPEFYIRGLRQESFVVDESKIKDVNYKRFITFCRMIIKLDEENSNKNVIKNIP